MAGPSTVVDQMPDIDFRPDGTAGDYSGTGVTAGKITLRDPETAESYAADFELDAARMQTAGTAWDSETTWRRDSGGRRRA